MPLTPQQLTDLRADIGDQDDPFAFTNDELDRLYDRTGTYDKAKLLAFEQLLSNAAKFYNYVSGHTRQEQEVIFDHLLKLYELQADKLGLANQVIFAGLRFVPPIRRRIPRDAIDQSLDELHDFEP